MHASRTTVSGQGGGGDRTAAGVAARMNAVMDTEEGRRLLHAYLASRAKPSAAAQAEQEAHLRQLAEQGELPGGKALLWPRTEGFVVKGRRVRSGGREEEEEKREESVFLNVVVSARLPAPRLEGGVWHVPNALGPPRVEKDTGAWLTGRTCGSERCHR